VLEQDLKSSEIDLKNADQRNLSFVLEADERKCEVTELKNE
jgi:hypothetical protein